MNDKSSKQKRARNQADAQFIRPAQTDKDSAMAEYKAQAQVARDKTERLRALRLAKEAADAKAAPPKKRTGPVKTAAGPAEKRAPVKKTASPSRKPARVSADGN